MTQIGVSSTLKDQHLIALARAAPRLTHVHLHWCHKISDDGLAGLLAERPAIEVLRLDRCARLTDASLHAVARYSGASLRVLSISHVHHMTEAGLLAIAQHCPNLVYLNVTCCDRITDVSLVPLLQRCTALRHLNARLAMVAAPSMVALTKATLPLESLNIIHLQNEYPLDLLLQAVMTQTHLQTLHLSLDNQLTTEVLLRLLQQHPALRHVHLSRCTAIEQADVDHYNALHWACPNKPNVHVTLDIDMAQPLLEMDHLPYI